MEDRTDLFEIELPKWPALIVVGEDVTVDQAKEINIRTSSLDYFFTNEHEYVMKLYKYLYNKEYIKTTSRSSYASDLFDGYSEYKRAYEKLHEELGLIDLEYLGNHNIVSSWVGGPHGWCSWSGRIFSDNYNIGKWPNVETVYKEWVAIAEAFPYLKLKSQLLNGETSEEDTVPLIEYELRNGQVKARKPSNLLKKAHSLTDEEVIASVMQHTYRRREIGCEYNDFVAAVEYVRKLMKINFNPS